MFKSCHIYITKIFDLGKTPEKHYILGLTATLPLVLIRVFWLPDRDIQISYLFILINVNKLLNPRLLNNFSLLVHLKRPKSLHHTQNSPPKSLIKWLQRSSHCSWCKKPVTIYLKYCVVYQQRSFYKRSWLSTAVLGILFYRCGITMLKIVVLALFALHASAEVSHKF